MVREWVVRKRLAQRKSPQERGGQSRASFVPLLTQHDSPPPVIVTVRMSTMMGEGSVVISTLLAFQLPGLEYNHAAAQRSTTQKP